MTFKPGHKKVGGRKKGSPDKRSLLVHEILQNNGINLIEKILVDLPAMDNNARVNAMIQMLPYVYPRLSAMQHTGEVNHYLEKSLEELEVLVKEKLQIEYDD